ncbi:hypothetical protein ROGSH02058M1_l10520 [Raoultella ornithinolytica]|nr:hypothetical protein ROGSH02058M1_l10520 [Raoultella ornithinolytica]
MKIENRMITKRERFFIYILSSILSTFTVYLWFGINRLYEPYAMHLYSVFGYDANTIFNMFYENGLLGIIGKELILSYWLWAGAISILCSSQRKTALSFLISSSIYFSILSIIIILLDLYIF